MIDPREISEAISPRLRRVLLAAEVGLRPEQAKAFKTILFDEFGKNGLEADLHKLISALGHEHS